MTQNNLGETPLRSWVSGESTTVRLEQAVEALPGCASGVHPGPRAEFSGATTQNNLGNAFRALGERESTTVRLEQAVEANTVPRLSERTRDRVGPLQWASDSEQPW